MRLRLLYHDEAGEGKDAPGARENAGTGKGSIRWYGCVKRETCCVKSIPGPKAALA